MSFLQNIHIRNFRVLRDLKLEGFRRFNLFVGPNDTGKTSALEAIALGVSAGDFQKIIGIGNWLFRGHQIASPEEVARNFSFLFSNMEPGKISLSLDMRLSPFGSVASEVEIFPRGQKDALPYGAKGNPALPTLSRPFMALQSEAKFSGGVKAVSTHEIIAGDEGLYPRTIKREIQFPKADVPIRLLTCVFVGDSDVASAIDIISRDRPHFESVLDVLRVIEPKLVDIRLGKNNYAIAAIGDRIVPMHLMGDGFKEILSILGPIPDPAVSLFFIDEIAKGVYHGIQPDFLRALLTFARKNDKQIFAVTHSKDLLVALAEVLEKDEEFREDAVCFSFSRVKHDEVFATAYPYEAIAHCLKNDIEFR